MKRDVQSGVLLIAGALAFVGVMLLHPTAHGLLGGGAAAERLGILNRLVHGVALAAAPAMFLGMLGLHARLAASRTSLAALVAWGFGTVTVAGAAIASGFVAPGVIEHIKAANNSRVPDAFLLYTGLWNQGFAAVNVVAWGSAIVLWSAAILRTRRLPAWTGTIGVVVGSLVLLGFLSGHVRTDVHGYGILTFLEAAWLLSVGIALSLPSPGEAR